MLELGPGITHKSYVLSNFYNHIKLVFVHLFESHLQRNSIEI
ncbi:unnamed protein product [Linum tenue]|uniref:Uncharacterized protein n=1 Tax=Linum tenue TaxID=586396 RepID=A0AAV0MW82_9ROSI|nr:unnamed protein product [Linum tenue]